MHIAHKTGKSSMVSEAIWQIPRFFGTLPNPEKGNNDFFSRHYEIALLLVIAWCGFVELPDFPWMRMGGNLSSRQTVSPTNPSFWSLGDEDVHFIIVVGNSFIIDDRVWWVRLSSFNRPLLKRSIQFLSLNARQVMIRRDGSLKGSASSFLFECS